MSTSTLFNDVDVAELYAQLRDVVDQSFMDAVASALGCPGGRIVDIGAGTGGPADALSGRGYSVVAVEPSLPMISAAQKRYPALRTISAVGEDLPLGDATFDAALVMYVLHHADDPVHLLAEAGRTVGAGGRVVVVSGAEACPRQRFFERYFPSLAPELPGRSEITSWAAEAGLQVARSRVVPHWVYPNRIVDESYMRMVETKMFSSVRGLNQIEFDEGLRELRADLGHPIPASRATLVILEPEAADARPRAWR